MMDSTSSNSQTTPSKEEPQKFIKELDKYAQRILKEAIISLVTQDDSLIPKFREALAKVANTKTRGRRNSQPPPLNPTDSPRRGRAYQRRNSVSSGSSFNFGKTELGKRIYLYTNGGKGSGIAMMVPKTWDLLLDEAGQKLRYGQAVTKIFDYDTGNQLNQVEELQAGMKIIGIPDNQKFHHPSEDSFRRASIGKPQTPRTPTKKSVKQAWAPKSPRTVESKTESRHFPEASVPIRRISPAPQKTSAPPAKSVSPAPAKSVSPAPAKPVPNKSVSPAPAKTVSPAPAKTVSPAPAKSVSPAPTKGAPATKRTSPAPSKSVSPAPAKSVSPAPATKQSSSAPTVQKEPEPKKEEPKQETKKEEPKKEEPKPTEVPKPVEVKKEEPKKEEPKKEEPKVEPKPAEVPKPVEVKKEEPKVEPIISPRKEEVPKVEVTKVEAPATQTPLTQALSPRQLKADQEVASVTQKPQETVKKSESTDSLSATSPVSATSPARVLSPQEKEAEIKRSIEDRIMERVRMMKQTKQ